MNPKDITAIDLDTSLPYDLVGDVFDGQKPTFILAQSEEETGIFDDGIYYIADEPFTVGEVEALYENDLL